MHNDACFFPQWLIQYDCSLSDKIDACSSKRNEVRRNHEEGSEAMTVIGLKQGFMALRDNSKVDSCETMKFIVLLGELEGIYASWLMYA